ncbi:helix-turn-helix domain-containing protein [Halalkalibacillus halophilus]|uniref:helix-turn-helix domain-containing protein n=1 Tax=Halalkalibacillus halophilus TaxID=392827 RepID=UPI0003F8E460|nr:helix-turn-helix domain-containing protein [Halalkalibacillus halophilus]
MDFIKLVYTLLIKVEGQRSYRSVYHLLKGKKSAQTIQDAHLFGVKNYFAIYPKLHIDVFDSIIVEMSNQGLINLEGTNFQVISKTSISEKPYANLNGYEYHTYDEWFFSQLLLLAQATSQHAHQSPRFIPIVDDIQVQHSVKRIWNMYKNNEKVIIEQLYSELHRLFELLTQEEANFISMQLTGNKHIGWSFTQLSEYYHLSYHDIHIWYKQTLHKMIHLIKDSNQTFSLLALLIPVTSEFNLTSSARKTYNYLQKNYSINQIMAVRNLKISTIEDHVVEIASSVDDFSIRPFVTEEMEQDILAVISKLNTRKLKEIKDQLTNNESYFQIRLAMTCTNSLD